MRQFIPLITQKTTTSHHHPHHPQHSAQKPRFCAREARKRGFRRAKKHKNLDFVLEMPENEGSKGQKRTKTPILCSKSPKTGVLKAKKAQKPTFCARKARKWGFRRQKKHKNPDFVLEMIGIGTRKRGNWHREAQPLPSCKSPRTLPKYKHLITRQLTFVTMLGEHKLRPPRTPMCPRGA